MISRRSKQHFDKFEKHNAELILELLGKDLLGCKGNKVSKLELCAFPCVVHSCGYAH